MQNQIKQQKNVININQRSTGQRYKFEEYPLPANKSLRPFASRQWFSVGGQYIEFTPDCFFSLSNIKKQILIVRSYYATGDHIVKKIDLQGIRQCDMGKYKFTVIAKRTEIRTGKIEYCIAFMKSR